MRRTWGDAPVGSAARTSKRPSRSTAGARATGRLRRCTTAVAANGHGSKTSHPGR